MTFSHFRWIAVSADMHVKGGRICTQQVVMNGRDLKSAFDQLGHHWIDFGFEEYKVAHNHRAPMHWLKCHPATKASAGLIATPSSVTERSVRGKP